MTFEFDFWTLHFVSVLPSYLGGSWYLLACFSVCVFDIVISFLV